MEDLIRSLGNLGLRPPDAQQLWELLDDDPEVQSRLVKLLAFNVQSVDLDDGQSGEASAVGQDVASLMGQDLLQEAVAALLDNFRRTIDRQRQTASREEAILHTQQSQTASNGKGKDTGKATKPVRCKLPPRKALLLRHEAALRKDAEERRRAPSYRPRLIFDGTTSFHSFAALDQLQPIDCSAFDLVPKRYEGQVLLARVITPILFYVGATLVVEDQQGIAIPISISHFSIDLNLSTEDASALLPVGTVLAIREPFVSMDHQARAGPCHGTANVGIRIDSPTDVVVLERNHPMPQGVQWSTEVEGAVPDPKGLPWLRDPTDADDWLAMANDLRLAGRPGAAHRAWLRYQGEKNTEEAQSIHAAILYNLRAWQQCQEVLATELHADGAKGQDDETLAMDFAISFDRLSRGQAMQRCALRRDQAQRPLTVDEVRSIYFAAPTVRRFDTSEFVGPVKVQDIEGAGRGLVTTREVQPGELLLCCRAVGSAYPDDKESQGSPLLRLNLGNGVVSATSQVRAQTNLIHRMVDQPELAKPILGLTAGPSMAYSRYVEDPFPTTTAADLQSESYDLPSIDAAYVDGVLRFNAFGPAQSPARATSSDSATMASTADQGELGKSTMPHPLPAILNHACLPNVASIFFSDIVTTRALAVLPAGTEIVHQYVRGEEPYAIRAAQLSKHGFECGCSLCQLDRSDGIEACRTRARIVQGESRAILERSRMLLKRIDMARLGQVALNASIDEDDLEAHRDVLEALQQLVQRIDATYGPQRGGLRPDLLAVQMVMLRHRALLCHGDDDLASLIEEVKQAIAAVGGRIDPERNNDQAGVFIDLPRLHMDTVIELMLTLATVLLNRQQQKEAEAWVHATLYAHQCMISGGRDVFLDRWQCPQFAAVLQQLPH